MKIMFSSDKVRCE